MHDKDWRSNVDRSTSLFVIEDKEFVQDCASSASPDACAPRPYSLLFWRDDMERAHMAAGDIVIWPRLQIVEVGEVASNGRPIAMAFFSSNERAIEFGRQSAEAAGTTLWVVHGIRWERVAIACAYVPDPTARAAGV